MSEPVTYDGFVCVLAAFIIGLCVGVLLSGLTVKL